MVNGTSEVRVTVGFLDRVRAAFSRGGPPPLDPARHDLVVVVESFDEVEACSAALARSDGWRADEAALLRHHLVLAPEYWPRAREIAAQDGYGQPASTPADAPVRDDELVLARVQVLDALHCSQERSRMAGLAQRLGGRVRGWDALQPPAGNGAGPGR